MPYEATVIYFESPRDNLFLRGISGIIQHFLNSDYPHFLLNASKISFQYKRTNFNISCVRSLAYGVILAEGRL